VLLIEDLGLTSSRKWPVAVRKELNFMKYRSKGVSSQYEGD
jgi:hypothetical protein